MKIDYNQILEVKVRLFKGGRFMAAAKKILVIVESPSKAKTIGKFFPPEYTKEQITAVVFELLAEWKENKVGEE